MMSDPISARHSISRRAALQIGCSSGLGLALPQLFSLRDATADKARSPAKQVLFVFLAGGPSHIDSFDMKPDAPPEIRGEFQPIATQTPGIHLCEHLPLLAQRMDKYAMVRTLALKTQADAVHELATPLMLSGTDTHPPGTSTVWSRNDWPCYGSALEYVHPRSDGVPSGVMLPYRIEPFPGQNAGFLGPRYDPWQISTDLNNPRFDADVMRFIDGMTVDRLAGQSGLLAVIDAKRRQLDRFSRDRQFSGQQQRAMQLLSSRALADAFAVDHEPQSLRDLYGDHLWGQSLLLGRRLIEAGVPIVQATLGHPYYWDTHTDNFNQHRDRLLPPFDRALSALLDDMEASGLLAETLLVVTGEFGRTPKVGGNVGTPTFSPTGRDHWVFCFTGLFAGAGVNPGQVIGATDATASYPLTPAFYPSDIGATIFETLGVDPHVEIRDRQGRPYRVNDGRVMDCLYS